MDHSSYIILLQEDLNVIEKTFAFNGSRSLIL